MKIFIIEYTHPDFNKLEIAVQDKDIVHTAVMLEENPKIKNYYIDGLNIPNQQKLYNVSGFNKWISPVSM